MNRMLIFAALVAAPLVNAHALKDSEARPASAMDFSKVCEKGGNKEAIKLCKFFMCKGSAMSDEAKTLPENAQRTTRKMHVVLRRVERQCSYLLRR